MFVAAHQWVAIRDTITCKIKQEEHTEWQFEERSLGELPVSLIWLAYCAWVELINISADSILRGDRARGFYSLICISIWFIVNTSFCDIWI